MEGSDKRKELLSTPSCLSFLADAVSGTGGGAACLPAREMPEYLNVQVSPNFQHDVPSELQESTEVVWQWPVVQRQQRGPRGFVENSS